MLVWVGMLCGVLLAYLPTYWGVESCWEIGSERGVFTLRVFIE